MDSQRHIYSVSEINALAREALEGSFNQVWLEAELSNLARPGSGHWYFSLKDKHAQIRCAFFRNRNRLLTFAPQDGKLVLVRGRISLYEARGDYQLIVDHMELAGEGELQRAYEQLKNKLLEKGLFDSVHKRKLPAYPQSIGIITSPSGAAIKDIQNIHARRFPGIPLILYPTLVQGESAAEQIVAMIETAVARKECDVLILTRGGGSLEDLCAFNDEKLAQAIFNCPIPIITGIGHEIDFTVADFVADVRAPTPSAAVELATPDQTELSAYLAGLLQQISEQMQLKLRVQSQQLDWCEQHLVHFHPEKQITRHLDSLHSFENRLHKQINIILINQRALSGQIYKRLYAQSPSSHIEIFRKNLGKLTQQLVHKTMHSLGCRQQDLSGKAHKLNMVSPLSTLSRGYSITSKHKSRQLIRHINEIAHNDMIVTQLVDGRIVSKVESRHEEDL